MARKIVLVFASILLVAIGAVLLANREPAKVNPVDVLMTEASRYSRYPRPKKPPIVVALPDEVMHPLLGMFRSESPGIIYVNASTPPIQRRSVLVHELVHYLQHVNGVLPKSPTCAERAAYEAEAYVATYRFEIANGIPNRGLDVTRSNCAARGIPDVPRTGQ